MLTCPGLAIASKKDIRFLPSLRPARRHENASLASRCGHGNSTAGSMAVQVSSKSALVCRTPLRIVLTTDYSSPRHGGGLNGFTRPEIGGAFRGIQRPDQRR